MKTATKIARLAKLTADYHAAGREVGPVGDRGGLQIVRLRREIREKMWVATTALYALADAGDAEAKAYFANRARLTPLATPEARVKAISDYMKSIEGAGLSPSIVEAAIKAILSSANAAS